MKPKSQSIEGSIKWRAPYGISPHKVAIKTLANLSDVPAREG